MSRVILIEGTDRVDVTQAAKFGDLVYLFRTRERRGTLFEVSDYVRTLKTMLRQINYNPAQDFICIVGRMIPVTLLGMAVMSLVHQEKYSSPIKLLLWNAVDDQYVVRVLTSDERTKETDHAQMSFTNLSTPKANVVPVPGHQEGT